MHNIIFHPEVSEFYSSLPQLDQARVDERVEYLRVTGPGGRRPVVGTITGSRHSNMKELICPNDIRILFAFDPESRAILLVGGTKTNQWKSWYKAAVPLADDRYDEWLGNIE